MEKLSNKISVGPYIREKGESEMEGLPFNKIVYGTIKFFSMDTLDSFDENSSSVNFSPRSSLICL